FDFTGRPPLRQRPGGIGRRRLDEVGDPFHEPACERPPVHVHVTRVLHPVLRRLFHSGGQLGGLRKSVRSRRATDLVYFAPERLEGVAIGGMLFQTIGARRDGRDLRGDGTPVVGQELWGDVAFG